MSESASNQVCREFLRGECDRGSGCKFSHPDSNEGSNNLKDKVCRDFLRDECLRGDRCIFKHPGGMQGTEKVIKFCHNFQNGRCPREGCTYLHCSEEEEEYYKKTGKLPPGIEADLKVEHAKKVCKDFLNGKCFRSQCKFSHPEPEYYGGPPPRKRPMPAFDEREGFYPPMREDRERTRSLMRLVNDLEDENVVLRHKLSRMHRQVLDLTDDNKSLLEDNRRLRADPEAPRAAPTRRPEASSTDLDSYLRERPVAVPAPHAPALDPVTSRAAARSSGFESDQYASERPYESRLTGTYEY